MRYLVWLLLAEILIGFREIAALPIDKRVRKGRK